jgi:hypothetical protein
VPAGFGQYAIAPGDIASQQGHCYIARVQCEMPGDRDSRSGITVWENGVQLGPGHQRHELIRSTGGGSFSYWVQGTLYFSTSDNTDPRTNGRKYEIRWPLAEDAPVGRVAQPEPTRELLSNPGFEALRFRDPLRPKAWSLENFYDGLVQRIAISTDGRNGSKCIRIEPKAQVVGLKSEVLSLQACQRYEVSMWARVLAPRGAKDPHPEVDRFDALLGDVTFQTFSAEGARDIVGTRTQTRMWLDRRAGEWTKVSTVFMAPPDASFGVLYLRFNAEADGFLVDDVSVRVAPEPPDVLEFVKPCDFVALTASREDASIEDVCVDSSGIHLVETSNLAPNPFLAFGPEGGTSPDRWRFAASDALATCVPVSPEKAMPFTSAAEISRSTTQGWCEIVSPPITIDPNDPYVLSVNYAFEGEGQPQLRLIGGDGQEHHQLDLFRKIAGYGWLREQMRLPPGKWKGEAAKTVRIVVRLYGGGTLKVSGVVLRAGRAEGTATAATTTATRGTVVSPKFEIGAVRSVRVSWDVGGGTDAGPGESSVDMFTRVGPEAEHDPRTWTDWHPVTNGGEAFIPIHGSPLYMQFRADLRVDPATGASPFVKSIRVSREPQPRPPDSLTQVIRLKEGFIDPRDMVGGWRAFPKVDPAVLAKDPVLAALARDRATGATSELDMIARVREHVMQHLVLFNAYKGGGHGSRGIEIIGQGTGVGCGDVNTIYGTALAQLGILSRYVELGGLDGSGHATVEVWSNDLNKWALSDCFYGSVYIEREGIPLSLAEMFDLWRQDRMDEVTYSPWGAPSTLLFRGEKVYTHGKSAPGPMRKRADSFLAEFVRYTGDPGVSLQRDGFPTSRFAPLTPVSGSLVARHGVEYKLNQTVINVCIQERGGASVSLAHNMPGFDRFEVRFDPYREWSRSPTSFEWPLREGHNQMEVRAVNWAGARGPVAEIGLRHWRLKSAETAVTQDSTRITPANVQESAWPEGASARVPITFGAGLYDRTDALAEVELPVKEDSYVPLALVEHTALEEVAVPFAMADDRVRFQVSGTTPVMGHRQYTLYLGTRSASMPDTVSEERQAMRRTPTVGWLDWLSALGAGQQVFATSRPGADVTIKIAGAVGSEGAGSAERPYLRVCNRLGQRASLLSEAFPISPDVPVEVRFRGRARTGQGGVRLSLRMLDAAQREIGSVAGASLSKPTPEWEPAFFYGLTHPNAQFGQLRLDVDGEEIDVADVFVGPRTIPESGPAWARAGAVEHR